MTYYKYNSFTQAAETRFKSYYKIADSGCWEWQLYRDSDGYGQFSINVDRKKRVLRAHRYSWIMANRKDWPPNFPIARHLCNNPGCVNPDHIVPGTVKDNTADAIAAGTHYNGTNSRKRPVRTPLGDFNSIAEAARATGMRNTLIWGMINKGHPGYAYL